MTPGEKNYSQIEKEGLELVYAIKKFHKMLYDFTLLTDHQPLLAIFESKKGVPAHSANRLQRWCILLRAYNFKIEYRNITAFGQANALSRFIAVQKTPKDKVVLANFRFDTNVNAIIRQIPVNFADVQDKTRSDERL